jgi:hypothetical protein
VTALPRSGPSTGCSFAIQPPQLPEPDFPQAGQTVCCVARLLVPR